MIKRKQTIAGGFLVILIGIVVICMVDVSNIAAAEVNKLPKKNFDMAAFYWIVGIVGGCIAITLSYVSIRKYKDEQKKQTKKDSNS